MSEDYGCDHGIRQVALASGWILTGSGSFGQVSVRDSYLRGDSKLKSSLGLPILSPVRISPSSLTHPREPISVTLIRKGERELHYL